MTQSKIDGLEIIWWMLAGVGAILYTKDVSWAAQLCLFAAASQALVYVLRGTIHLRHIAKAPLFSITGFVAFVALGICTLWLAPAFLKQSSLIASENVFLGAWGIALATTALRIFLFSKDQWLGFVIRCGILAALFLALKFAP